MLSISVSIFNPLGFIVPVTAKIKTIFQLLCKGKLDWDEIIPEKIADVWTKFVEELKRLVEVHHSRLVLTSSFCPVAVLSFTVFVTAPKSGCQPAHCLSGRGTCMFSGFQN
jgi:hypothetical protein